MNVKIFALFVFFTLFFLGTVSALLNPMYPGQSAWKDMACDEKLIVCVDSYNNCSADFQRGENCGVAFGIMNSYNEQLLQKVEFYSTYRIGFWGETILIALACLVWLVKLKKKHIKDKKQE